MFGNWNLEELRVLFLADFSLILALIFMAVLNFLKAIPLDKDKSSLQPCHPE